MLLYLMIQMQVLKDDLTDKMQLLFCFPSKVDEVVAARTCYNKALRSLPTSTTFDQSLTKDM